MDYSPGTQKYKHPKTLQQNRTSKYIELQEIQEINVLLCNKINLINKQNERETATCLQLKQ